MVSLMQRRRELMTPDVIPGEKLFVGASWMGTNNANGAITKTGDYINLKSTAPASWNVSGNPYGAASNFKKYSDVKGHTIRVYFSFEWNSYVADGLISVALGIFDSITNQYPTRRRYVGLNFNSIINNVTNGTDGSGILDYVIPTTITSWPSGSGGSDNSYVRVISKRMQLPTNFSEIPRAPDFNSS